MKHPGIRIATGVLLAVAAAAPASAHEFWLAPLAYRATRGDTVEIRAFVGTGFRGEAKTFVPSRVKKFAVRESGTREIGERGEPGDLRFGRFVAKDDGGAMVSYLTDFARIELPAGEFDAYLALEGLEAPRRERAAQGANAGPGRERYARCAKSWIAGHAAARGTAPTGLPFEIVPLSAPGTAPALRVRVLFRGKPLAGALVRAWRQPLAGPRAPTDAAVRDSVGPAAERRTAADGTAELTLAEDGEWLIAAVHMVRCADPADADWESWWASLTFARFGGAR